MLDLGGDVAAIGSELAARLSLPAPTPEQLAAAAEELPIPPGHPTEPGSIADLASALYRVISSEPEEIATPLLLSAQAAARAERELKETKRRLAWVQEASTRRIAELRDLQDSYARLRSRKVVRASLAAIQAVEPLFRAARRVRRPRRAARPGPSPPRNETPPSPLAADAIERLLELPAVTVLIPVFNVVEAVERCLDAVIRNTTRPANVLVIDDASTDPRITELLDSYRAEWPIRVVRNPENLGFVRTVNRGFGLSDGDVVVLNSDTEVTPRWLDNLRLAAYRDPSVGTVTPLSDNAGAFSAPKVGTNHYPPGLVRDDLGRLVTRHSKRLAPAAPTGNAFCMYVKRALLDQIGGFDEVSFPRGYGEENDFCMRALKAGWKNVVDDATLVFHQREASFGAEKAGLLAAGRRKVDELHPEYTRLVRQFLDSPVLARVRANVARALAAALDPATGVPVAVPTRALFVHHQGTGGTPQTNQDLMAGLQHGYETYVLTSNTKTLRLPRFDGSSLAELERLELDAPIRVGEWTRPEVAGFLSRVLVDHAIEIVHVRNLLSQSFDLPRAAAALGIPVVLSFHDYLMVCPTVHLLDENDRFCFGRCTPGPGPCRMPTPWLAEAPPPKHDFVYTWQQEVRDRVLSHTDALVTTSPTAQAVVERALGVDGIPFSLIEHGRDLPRQRLATPPPSEGPVRVLVPGNLDPHKGADLIRAIRHLDIERRLEFHFAGRVPAEYHDLGVQHGPYRRDGWFEVVEQTAPSFVGLFSIWAETYSHTLTEAWAAGIPVIAGAIGALQERVTRHGGGVLVDPGDGAAACRTILAVCDDPESYAALELEAFSAPIRPVATMASHYDALYRSVLLRRRAVQRVGPPEGDQDDVDRPESGQGHQRSGAAPCRSPRRGEETAAQQRVGGQEERVLRVGLLVVTDHSDKSPGTVHVRSLRRLFHPLTERTVQSRRFKVIDFVDDPPPLDVVLVQRTAIPSDLTGWFLEAVERSGAALVVDLDDSLHDLPEDAQVRDHYSGYVEGLERIVAASDLVTVSTAPLLEEYRSRALRVELVRNVLDERLWFRGMPAPSTTRGPFRLVYIGSITHGRDLRMLRPIVDELQRQFGDRIELEVVGGEPEGPDQDWYHRLPLSSDLKNYPEFVPFLFAHRHRWDLALAPLEDTRFNAAKSDLKFLEYSALGLPGVYSEVPSYRSSVRHGETGLLLPDEIDAWVAAIASLIEDPARRRAMAVGAHTEVVATRGLIPTIGSYVDMLASAAGETGRTLSTGFHNYNHVT